MAAAMMEKLLWCFLISTSFSGVFGHTDLSNKVFVFPRESGDSYVSLEGQLTKPLEAFTVCLWLYTELSKIRSFSIFSYATTRQPNEILIFWTKAKGYTFGVGGPEVLFKAVEMPSAPVHLCASWESATGIAELWIDGRPRVRMSLNKGYTVATEASIILGQEQDSFAGSFDTNQCFVGDIGNVNMWDFVLSPDEISTVYAGGPVSPDVLNWSSLKYRTNGEVFIKPKLWS